MSKTITKLVEVATTNIYNRDRKYSLREVFVNPDFVVSLMPDDRIVKLLKEVQLPDGLDNRQQFTRVLVHKGNAGLEMTVVGNVESIRDKLFSNGATLLKG